MKFKRTFYLIPAPILNLVFKDGLYKELKAYMYLKAISNGHLSKIDKSKLARELQFSRSTTIKVLDRLVQRNWIGINPGNGYYHIRSFKSLSIIEGYRTRLGVWFSMSDLHEIEAFVDSATVSEIVRRKKVEQWRAQRKGSAVQLQQLYEVSARYFASYTGMSVMTAQRRLERAKKSKFLLHEKGKSAPLGKFGAAFKKGYPELADNVFYRNGEYWLRQPGKYQTTLTYKRRKHVCNYTRSGQQSASIERSVQPKSDACNA